MKKATFLILFLFTLSQIWAQMPLRPKKYTPVNDFARVLSSSQKKELADLLFQHEKTAGEQLVFVTVANMGGETVENFAQQLYNGWGIGKKGNGALVLIAMAERKARIQVGTGLENRLTEAARADILANQLVPNLKKGEFYQAFLQTAQVLTNPQENNQQNVITLNPNQNLSEVKYAEPEPAQGSGADWTWLIISLLGFGFLTFILLIIFGGSRRHRPKTETVALWNKTATNAQQRTTSTSSHNNNFHKTINNSSYIHTPSNFIDNSTNIVDNSSSYTDNSSSYTDNSSSYTDNSSSSSNDSSSSSDWGGGSSDSGSSSDW